MQSKFPSEIIELPSKGYFYPIESPLRSGTIELKYPTASEEDLLMSKNLIQKGLVLDRLLQALIITPINYDDLLTGDKNAILFASRILAYGNSYTVEVNCPACNVKNTKEIDLGKIDHKKVDFQKYFKSGEREVDFVLPASGVTLTLQIFTNKEEKQVEEALKGMKKMSIASGSDYEITTRLRQIITAINGDSDRKKINEFVSKDLLSKDSLAVRSFLKQVTPDVDATFVFECDECGKEKVMDIPIGITFLWPSA